MKAEIKHSKHASLEKPNGGIFHRNEWSIIGAPCPRIKELVAQIHDALKPEFNIGFMDDDHGTDASKNATYHSEFQKIADHYSYTFKSEDPTYNYRQLFESNDAVLLNGNHYTAKQQIVIINSKKKESLSKKLDRLTDVILVIFDEGETEEWDYLKNLHPSLSTATRYTTNEIDKIAHFLKSEINKSIPPLYGLVFAGGASSRMGEDKANIAYHGERQLDYACSLLDTLSEKTYISISDKNTYKSKHKQIPDSFIGLGPFGGLLSAFRKHPNVAWLTIPCDTPLIDNQVLEYLIENRNPSKYATCFHNPETQFPEPLITIWEPRSYNRLLHFLSRGYACPRKVLINSEIAEIMIKNPEKLKNANTPDERKSVLSFLASKS